MAKSELLHEVRIRLPNHEYAIHIGTHCLSDPQLLTRYVAGKQVLIVSNETVAPLYLDEVQQAFTGFQCNVVILPDGEAHKNQHNLDKIFTSLIEHYHHRDTTLFALGGGVIGDITGFAASTYQRGVRLIQLPTTLLAQVDASVGGKTAINHPLGKNMIGSFYQPHAVIIDLNTLNTLQEREFRAGFAEVIKYGLLEGGEFLESLCGHRSSLSALIAQCCQIKASIVEQDERECGKRALLNLGHTFAHALETYTHYERWLHGEAVAIGLYCAGLLSQQLGHLSAADLETIDQLLEQAKLPRRIPKEVNVTKLQELMSHDKKIISNTLRFVLLKGLGNCYIDSTVTAESLRHTLISALEGE